MFAPRHRPDHLGDIDLFLAMQILNLRNRQGALVEMRILCLDRRYDSFVFLITHGQETRNFFWTQESENIARPFRAYRGVRFAWPQIYLF